MNIGMVSIYDFGHPGGVNLHCAHLAYRYSKMGHRVRIMAPCSRPGAFPGVDDLIIPLGSPLSLKTAETIARIVLSMRLAPRVKSMLERENFDLIHFHEPLCPTLPTTIIRHSKAINIGTFHAYHGSRRIFGVSNADRLYTVFNSYVRKHWFNRLHDRIAVSPAARDFVAKHFPGKYHIIPNGIDLEHFSTRVEPIHKYMDGKVNILFVGRLEKRKGLRYLLDAYTQLKWDYPAIRLIVVGPGKLDPDSERIMGERNPRDVALVGPVTHDDLPKYYKTTHIFCSPATGKESFGMVLLEAMSLAKPVVASAIGGYSGVMTHGVEGFLTAPKNSSELAQALAHLVEDESLRQEMGARGWSHAQEFGWDKIADRVMNVYLNAMSSNGKSVADSPHVISSTLTDSLQYPETPLADEAAIRT